MIYREVIAEDAPGVWRLLKLAGWADAEPELPEWVEKLIEGSRIMLGAFGEDGTLAGMARVLSDGVSDAFIQDVVVDPQFRGRGIGAELVTRLVAMLTERGADWIGLVATPGNAEFYERLGFRVLEGFTPMRFGKSS